MCEKVGSVGFYSALNINVIFCTMGQLSPKAQGCAGCCMGFASSPNEAGF